MRIPIYSAEKALAKQIEQNSTIAYCQPISTDVGDHIKSKIKAHVKSLAKHTDPDLFYHTSILVSTTWNKNDDVFSPSEVWRARHTPEDKPTNIEHDEKRIIGHITGNWAIDENGKIIADDTAIDKLPTKFHVLNSSVIYRAWSDEDYKKSADELVEAIRAGEMFVSMECILFDFDYAFQKADGSIQIVERNENTSTYTKDLRIYGGKGIASLDGEDLKIGRYVKDIIFCGKGYVKKPANPESVIFTENDLFDFAEASSKIEEISDTNKNGVVYSSDKLINSGVDPMTDVLKEQNSELKETNKTLSDEIKALKEQLADANVEKFESTIDELKETLKSTEETVTNLEGDIKSKGEEIDGLKKELDEVTKAKETAEESLAKVEAESKLASRISFLVDKGVDKKKAEEKVEVFASLDDKQFEVIANEIVEAAKPKETPKSKKEEAERAESADLDSSKVEDKEAIDNTETDEDDDIYKVRASAAKSFASVFGVEISDEELTEHLSE